MKDVLHLKLCKMNMHTYTLHFMEIQQKDNETLAAYMSSFQDGAKRCDFSSDTVVICIFNQGCLWCTQYHRKGIWKGAPDLIGGFKLVENLNTAQQVTAIVSSSTVNMMSSHNKWFVCSRKGHIGCYCHDTQCYNCDSFSHFAQDCPEKMSPSETPHHHDRSCSPP